MITVDNVIQAVMSSDSIFNRNVNKFDVQHIVPIALDKIAFAAVANTIQIDLNNGYYLEINTIKKEE